MAFDRDEFLRKVDEARIRRLAREKIDSQACVRWQRWLLSQHVVFRPIVGRKKKGEAARGDALG